MTEITKITRSEEITYNAGITRNIEIIRYTKVVFSFMSVYLRLAVSEWVEGITWTKDARE